MQSTRVTFTEDIGGVLMIKPSSFASSLGLFVLCMEPSTCASECGTGTNGAVKILLSQINDVLCDQVQEAST